MVSKRISKKIVRPMAVWTNRSTRRDDSVKKIKKYSSRPLIVESIFSLFFVIQTYICLLDLIFVYLNFSKGEIVNLVKIILKFKGMKNKNQVDKYKSKWEKIEKKWTLQLMVSKSSY